MESGQERYGCSRFGPIGSESGTPLAFAGSRPESRDVRAGNAGEEAAAGTRLGRPLRIALIAALVVGCATRLALAFLRPLWADEVFTLALARKPLPDLLAALRLDSGPPLHYLAAKVLLAPFGGPGAHDVAVRLLSVVASLLHVPLLVRISRRRGVPSAGAVAACLFLVYPLAAFSGAEGRGYALASLLALASFERLLLLEEEPRARTALLAGLLGGAAVLTHYLALLPVAGALLAALVRRGPRLHALLASAVAATVAATWLPVALAQPRASMAWTEAQPLGERAWQAAANLGLGLSVEPGPALVLGPLGLVLLAAALLARRGRARVPAGTPLAASLVVLAPILLFSRSALLPDRTALVLLPVVALVLAEARAVLPATAGAASAVVLAASLPGALVPTPAAQLAARIVPEARAGASVVAADLWGPELDYRLARAGLAGRVTYVPSLVALHPGWYDESELSEERAAAEASAAVARARPQALFVLTPGTRASRALVAALGEAGGRRLADAGVFEVWTIPDRARPVTAGAAAR